MFCKICGSESSPFFKNKVTILHRYPINYYRCHHCNFIQTESPCWLPEAYDSAITSLDIGLVGRNIGISRLLSSLILSHFDGSRAFLDYGGGYGMLVRIMRDLGFDFYRFDTYSHTLHLIIRRKLNPLLFRLSLQPKVALIVAKVKSRKSLLQKDFDYIKHSISSNENTLRSPDLQ